MVWWLERLNPNRITLVVEVNGTVLTDGHGLGYGAVTSKGSVAVANVRGGFCGLLESLFKARVEYLGSLGLDVFPRSVKFLLVKQLDDAANNVAILVRAKEIVVGST